MLLLHVVVMANVGSRNEVIPFLAASILLGALLSGCFGVEEDVAEDLPPILDDHSSVPEYMTEGDVDRIEVEVIDEHVQTVLVEVAWMMPRLVLSSQLGMTSRAMRESTS